MSGPQSRKIRGMLLASVLAGGAALAAAQTGMSPAASSLQGSITTAPATGTPLPLSLDDAIQRGLQHNLALALAQQDKQVIAGERLEALNYLMPNLTWNAQRNRDQVNLEAEGFRRGLLTSFPPGFLTGAQIADFQPLVTVNVVSAQAEMNQILFDWKSFKLYRAAKQEIVAVNENLLSSRQDVVEAVADSYLQVLSDAANVANAKGLLATNAEILRQAKLEHEAGVAAKLDELRAEVQYQQQEQVVIAEQNTLEKAKITLTREIGLPADQQIELTDQTPFATITAMPLEDALQSAYANRQDYRRLQAKLRSAQYQRSAAKFERLPTLSFDGNYGVTGTVGGIYHGTFTAQGSLSVSLSRLAKFRGDREIAEANVTNALSQLANLKAQIEAQVRDTLLDITATQQLVDVARSNADLAQATLNDANDRFRNGVSDDLPVVQAQAQLAAAQAQLVSSLYQYNQAKLSLARNLGVIDQQYRDYLGAAPAAANLQTVIHSGL